MGKEARGTRGDHVQVGGAQDAGGICRGGRNAAAGARGDRGGAVANETEGRNRGRIAERGRVEAALHGENMPGEERCQTQRQDEDEKHFIITTLSEKPFCVVQWLQYMQTKKGSLFLTCTGLPPISCRFVIRRN